MERKNVRKSIGWKILKKLLKIKREARSHMRTGQIQALNWRIMKNYLKNQLREIIEKLRGSYQRKTIK